MSSVTEKNNDDAAAPGSSHPVPSRPVPSQPLCLAPPEGPNPLCAPLGRHPDGARLPLQAASSTHEPAHACMHASIHASIHRRRGPEHGAVGREKQRALTFHSFRPFLRRGLEGGGEGVE